MCIKCIATDDNKNSFGCSILFTNNSAWNHMAVYCGREPIFDSPQMVSSIMDTEPSVWYFSWYSKDLLTYYCKNIYANIRRTKKTPFANAYYNQSHAKIRPLKHYITLCGNATLKTHHGMVKQHSLAIQTNSRVQAVNLHTRCSPLGHFAVVLGASSV